MFQPEQLCTDHHVPWAWGIGNDVWSMLKAAATGDSLQLAALLAKEPSLVRSSYSYRNAFHFAVRESRIDAARLLLDSGSEITYTGERWHTSAPQMARDRGYESLAKLIADHQFENYQICSAGDQLADAIKLRDSPEVRSLLREHGPEVADARGNRPLHWAVMTRQFSAIDLCLDAGAEINATRPDGARAVDLSNGDYWYRGWQKSSREMTANHWPVVGYLLARGAEYDLTTACRIGDFDRVREIVSDDPGAANRDALYNCWYSGFPLRSAAKAGHLHIVEYLIDHGADPNKPEHGLAPWGGSVFDATQNGHDEVVRYLLDHGANPNQVVESSGSPLSIANNDQLRDLLKQHGAENDWFGAVYSGLAEDFRRHCKRNPLLASDSELFMMAASSGNRDLTGVFVEHDQAIWSRLPATLGRTPEITDWMVTSGMNVNQVNWLASHTLHNDFDVSELTTWVDLQVDLDLIDEEHLSTPLGMAARRGNVEQVQALIDAGADPHAAGAEFAKPIEWARRRGLDEIVMVLIDA